jgi:hypothetical protein
MEAAVKALALLLVLAVAGCAPVAELGGQTQATTTRVCDDGTRCPNWQDCPALATPHKCENPSGGIVEGWGARAPAPDAGP